MKHCYKGQEQLDWIQSTGYYNVRAYTRRGAVKTESKAERATRLLLYDVDNPAIYWLYKLYDTVDSADEHRMTELKYPRIRQNCEYFLYRIAEPLECPMFNVEKLIEKYKDEKWTKGKPIYVLHKGDEIAQLQ